MNNTKDKPVYKLLKDLPDMKAGQLYIKVLEPAGADYYIAVDKYDHNKAAEGKIYTAETVENNPDFFQLQQPKEEEQPKRFEVSIFGYRKKYTDPRCTDAVYSFYTNVPIPEEKYEAVKKAIEFVLSENKPVAEGQSLFNADKINDRIKQIEEMEDAFNEARLTHPMIGFKHTTFEDYINSKSPLTKYPNQDKNFNGICEILGIKPPVEDGTVVMPAAMANNPKCMEGGDVRHEFYEHNPQAVEDKETLKTGNATYLDGFQMGVSWCEKYGIPKNLTQVTSNASINCQNTERQKYCSEDVMGCYFAMGRVDDKAINEYLERIKD